MWEVFNMSHYTVIMLTLLKGLESDITVEMSNRRKIFLRDTILNCIII